MSRFDIQQLTFLLSFSMGAYCRHGGRIHLRARPKCQESRESLFFQGMGHRVFVIRKLTSLEAGCEPHAWSIIERLDQCWSTIPPLHERSNRPAAYDTIPLYVDVLQTEL